MNPFRQTIQDLSLTSDTQGTNNEYSWLFLLLRTLADIEDSDPATPTYPANPIKEVLHRLRAHRDTHPR